MPATPQLHNTAHHPLVGKFEPAVVLIEHDAPIVFTFMDAQQQLCLAYLAQAAPGQSVYLATVIEPDHLREVINGKVPVRDCFQGPCWQVTVGFGGRIQQCIEKARPEIHAYLPPSELRVYAPNP